ncbi:MAG: PLP-dependent aminotransferase family protein, partial [Turneriella sp.]
MRLDPDLSKPRDKVRPLFESLRREILAGRFAAGELLPSSRQLARELGIARGTVNLAIAQLAAEGLVTVEPAAGVRVAIKAQPRRAVTKPAEIRFSQWAERLPRLPQHGQPAFFATGRLADEFFPEREWRQAVKAGRNEADLLSSTVALSPAGYLPLRKTIAAHLQYSRGLAAGAENIVIVNGSMQALALTAQLLLEKGRTGAFEDPGFHGIRAAITMTGAQALALPLDHQGAQVPKRAAQLLFLTPASQFPTGVTMSHARRSEFTDYARRHNAFIVEDEYDSEFTRLANAPQPLKLIDHDDRVVYVGSFSRTMFASLRLGYCVLPHALMEKFLRARQLYDSFPPALADQAAMAAFMQAGHYRRHIRRMNRVYRERHDMLLRALSAQFAGAFGFSPSAAGLSLYGRWLKKR